MTADDWRNALQLAAECGSDCLRDTWVMVPAEQQYELAVWHWRCRIAAVASDIVAREGGSP